MSKRLLSAFETVPIDMSRWRASARMPFILLAVLVSGHPLDTRSRDYIGFENVFENLSTDSSKSNLRARHVASSGLLTAGEAMPKRHPYGVSLRVFMVRFEMSNRTGAPV